MKIRRRRRYRGQSLVEFALIAPLLFALLFVIIELGIVFSIYVGLSNSAREAARAGSIYQHTVTNPTPTVAAVDAARELAMDEAVMGTINPLIRVSAASGLNPTSGARYTYDPATPVLNNYRYGDKVKVTLSYPHQFFFRLLGSGSVRITASSEMRIEPGG